MRIISSKGYLVLSYKLGECWWQLPNIAWDNGRICGFVRNKPIIWLVWDFLLPASRAFATLTGYALNSL